MKVDMSPKAIENRLKLVGELTKACLLIRRQTTELQTDKSQKQPTKLKFASKNYEKTK